MEARVVSERESSVRASVKRMLHAGAFALCVLGVTGCGSDDNKRIIPPDEPEIPGCTDIGALNFQRSATLDDESCVYDESRVYRIEFFDVGVDAGTRQVKILIQVKGEDGQGVPGLSSTDFVIAENRRKLGTEANLSIDPGSTPNVIPTVLLLDISSSVEGLIPQIKEAAISLVSERNPGQRFAIYAFDKETELVQGFTEDVELLTDAINSIRELGLFDSTNLFGAIIDVAESWQDELSVDNIVDGSLIVFTDGFHNADPSLKMQDAIDAMVGTNGRLKKIYVAALNSPDLARGPLQQLTFDTEGFFEAADITELKDVLLQIQAEIVDLSNSIYLVSYTSPITNPESRTEEILLKILGNSNLEGDGRVAATFDSEGFGD